MFNDHPESLSIDEAAEQALEAAHQFGSDLSRQKELWSDLMLCIREWFDLLPDKRRMEAERVWTDMDMDAILYMVDVYYKAFYYGYKKAYGDAVFTHITTQNLYPKILRSEFQKNDSTIKKTFLDFRNRKWRLVKIMDHYTCFALNNIFQHLHCLGKLHAVQAFEQGMAFADRKAADELFSSSTDDKK